MTQTQIPTQTLAAQVSPRRRRWIVLTALALLTVGAIVLGVVLLMPPGPIEPPGADQIPGLIRLDADGNGDHTPDFINYQAVPPVSGPHHPVWQNCGFYAEPIRDEHAVHSLEHGTVWIAYRPDLGPTERDVIRSRTIGTGYVLASPYPNLPAPVILSAWGYQLRLEHADDDAIARFIKVFAGGSQAPEPGGPCHGGIGQPQ